MVAIPLSHPVLKPMATVDEKRPRSIGYFGPPDFNIDALSSMYPQRISRRRRIRSSPTMR
jgi:hypothetical protein